MMDDDCLAVSCVGPLVSSSYSTEPVSAVTAKRVLMNETASFEAYPSTSITAASDRAVGEVKGHMNIIKSLLVSNFKSCLRPCTIDYSTPYAACKHYLWDCVDKEGGWGCE